MPSYSLHQPPFRNKLKNSRVDVWIYLFLILLTLGSYWQLRHHEFIDFDDGVYVTSNRYVKNGMTLEGFMWSFRIGNENRTYWHPLTWLSHMLDVQLFGLNAGRHLMVNLLLHILNSLFLFYIFRCLTGDRWPAAVVAVFFALHPINVESVAWVAARKNLLSSFFWMLTLLAYGMYAERRNLARYLGVVLTFILGLMAKPMLVTLPFVLLLIDYWPIGSFHPDRIHKGRSIPFLRLCAEKIPLLAFSVLSVRLASMSLQGQNNLIPLTAVPLGLRIGNALVTYVGYIGKTIWPQRFSVFYPFPKELPLWQPVFAAMVLLLVTGIVYRMHRTKPYLIVGWLWYLGTLVPVSGLVQAGLWPEMADRFAYIPLIGLFVMIAWSVSDVCAGRRFARPAVVLATALGVFFAIQTWKQTAYWENSIKLFGHALELNENNILAHNNIGKALIDNGRVTDAVGHYVQALKVRPEYASAHKNLGAALAIRGETDLAIPHLLEALRIDPNSAEAHYNLGNIFSRQGETDTAIKHYGKALQLDPEYAEVHNNLGNLLAKNGRVDDAIKHYKVAVRLNPGFAKAHNNLGVSLARKGQLDQAVFHYRTALKIKPIYPEACNNLGAALRQQGLVNDAIHYYQTALRFQPDYREAHYNLGLSLIEIGKVDLAVEHLKKSLQQKPGDVTVQTKLKAALATRDAVNTEIETVKVVMTSRPEDPALHFKLGTLFKNKGDLDKAMNYFQKALSYDGQYIAAIKEMGAIYAVKGDLDKAASSFKKIVGLRPENAEACYWLAGIFALQHKTDEAVGWLEKAVNRGYQDWGRLKTDRKLKNIRHTTYYKKLMYNRSS